MTRRSAALALVTLIAACNDKHPTSPTVGIPTPAPVATRLTVDGPTTSFTAPNQTAQFTATVTFSDNTTRDVTADANWASSNQGVATVAAGLVTTVGLGEASILASYQSRVFGQLNIKVIPEGTFILSGAVREPGNVPLNGVSIEVVEGAQAGRSTIANGSYRLYGVVGDMKVRATKDGYTVQVLSVSVTRDQTLDFELRPLVAPAPIAANYRLDLTVSGRCFPWSDAVRNRTYSAEIAQDAALVLVTLSDATFVNDPRLGLRNKFSGRVSGDTVEFTLDSDYYYYYANDFDLIEVIAPGTTLGIAGRATAKATGQTLSAPLTGTVVLTEGNRATYCHATDHQLVFTRK